MKLKLLLLTIVLGFSAPLSSVAHDLEEIDQSTLIAENEDHGESHEENGDHSAEGHEEEHHASPSPISVLPFVLLLIMIATGPLFYAHFWHKYYPLIAMGLGLIVVVYYLAFLHDQHHPVHSLAEYASFISLLTVLFVASGGILIKVDKAGTPMVNIALLVFGAFIANIIGTTGASMLLIRPFIRLNKDRIKPYHIVFFIFMVSNVGGCLTPIGDPPLFLGFLKGVPFFWTVENVFPFWFFGISILSAMFYFVDRRNMNVESSTTEYTGKIEIKGLRNMIFLGVAIGAVFLDPNVLDWVPAINYHGDKLSFMREIIMLVTAYIAYKTSSEECLKGNEFDFEPIREVAFLFIGIFATMMPALQLIAGFASENTQMITNTSLYWLTGSLSGVLDNAPTYLNFLAAGMGKFGLDLGAKSDVGQFVVQYGGDLLAISVASVFFGAFTYIGNAPNFMVKSIAEQIGIEMPSFVGYVIKYSIPFLLPVLFLTWLFMQLFV